MPLYLNEDQQMLHDSAAEFMKGEAPVAHLREFRDRQCKDGFSHALWKQFAEMGFTGIMIGEDEGGLGLGHIEAGTVLEEIGRNLTPSPFLTTAVAGVEALNAGGKTLRDKYFPGILAGETVLGLAIDEGAKHRPDQIGMAATREGNGFKLDGKKQFVVQGGSADMLIVAARTSGAAGDDKGLTLFAVDANAAGVSRDSARLVDSAMAAHVQFDGVTVDADAVIGEVDDGDTVLRRLLNAGRAGAAAETLGVGAGSMDITVDYIKGRKQFGELIGSFQALQHRMAHLYSEMEIARAAVLKAQQMLDEGSSQAELMVSVAKAKAGRATALSVKEGVQMHGGVGMTDEYDIGLYMKRDRALQEFMGDANYHTNLVAEMHGY
ncbi:acyl-CoA dehydrogenase family protein [Sphingorhabdus sp. 109]|jgi:alkylation response protein AidB-like acyl-CoA dehydrogenase|uniref:acyl-CoA dehydrogenase family protein n=1 Tax=Sphingorhabdus sp. 109 TaxID=2653173 RepID=UPI0012F43AE3|nr:acyl-CoA dehydrogenase family protein [Sphingorhabdus sp. 109]VWX56316.1 Acyl-CoA dehydrogenase [Sphingorhabdus sp. 109]